jgi:hypothetical protein
VNAPPPPSPVPFPSHGWRRAFEIGFWVLTTLVNAVTNSVTVLIDIRRNGLDFAAWRAPLHWDTWRRTLPLHVLASVVFSVVHVLGMVAIREAVYAAHGAEYDFGPWLQQLIYEYLKDVRSYAGMVVLIEGYRFIRRRLQGEASLLGEPDEGPPVEPVERPDRFLVRKLGREFLVAASDVEWLQAAGNYVNLRVRGHDYPLRCTMAAIEERLDPARFARIHRSYMVNLGQVASIEPLDTGDARVHLADGTVLPCSRRHREALRERAGFA